jgi:hypothetical protein
MIELSEEEWFDKYYPKEWGDWRNYYNIEEYCKNTEATGCTWLNYRTTGWVSGKRDGLMEINSRREYNSYLNSTLFSVNEEVGNTFCGAKQPDGTIWVQATIYKQESNLDLYTIRLFGIDDASYSKDFIGLDSLLEGWSLISYVLEDPANLNKEHYYFTN